MKHIEMIGKRYGKLTVIERAEDYVTPTGRRIVMYKCLCDCGRIKDIKGDYLRSGHTSSCGCLNKKIFLDGETRLREIWGGMKKRCYNSKSPNYKYYGGRGIKVCDEWLEKQGAENFRNWALANGYRDDLTIDRIDNNKGYSPDNCRWFTQKEQSSNRRNTIYLTYQGKTHTIIEWAKITGIPIYTLRYRYKRGYDVERILE